MSKPLELNEQKCSQSKNPVSECCARKPRRPRGAGRALLAGQEPGSFYVSGPVLESGAVTARAAGHLAGSQLLISASVGGQNALMSRSFLPPLILGMLFCPSFPSAGIVISSSASPTEGTSSDSCLTSSSNDSSVALSSCLAGQVMTGSPAAARMTSAFLASQSDAPVLQAQGCMGGASLLPVSFQEGRRASDTSLTQGNSSLALLLGCLPCHWEREAHRGLPLCVRVVLRHSASRVHGP